MLGNAHKDKKFMFGQGFTLFVMSNKGSAINMKCCVKEKNIQTRGEF
jgi:hypothetical protein